MSIKYLLCFCIAMQCINLTAQNKPSEPSINNLLYCNSYFNISKLWIINKDMAVGSRQFKGQNHIRDIVLIGSDGLIKDSISLINAFNTRDYFFQQIENIQQESDSLIYVQSGRTIIPVKLKSQKFTFSDTSLVRMRKKNLQKLYDKDRELFATHILQIGNLIVGYDRDKIKVKKEAVKKKNDEGNFPNFWVINVNDKELTKNYINRDTEPVTNSLFWDVNDWDYTWDRTSVFSKYVNVHQGKIYFNVVRANKCYVYDIKSEKITAINFPEIVSGESCNYYYDYSENKEYVVKRDKSNMYHVYLFNKDHSAVYSVISTYSQPFNIINGFVHVIKDQKENNQVFKCHYLLPINDSKNEERSILKETVIKDKNK